MNLANKLTVFRLLLIPVLMIFTFIDNFYTRLFALTIFIIAGITDLYDGAIARRTNTVTTLGIFLDPLADKLLISAVLVSFVELREINIPAWMIVLVISREFIITGLRLVAVSKGRVIASTKSGKFKTSSQVTTIITIFVVLIVNSGLYHFLDIPIGSLVYYNGWINYAGLLLEKLPYWLMFLTTILTVMSGVTYIIKNKDVLVEK
ncbi:MAG: CDP-diacylglycerol--glycerol-3-phosphate 3-phosphatidyltransferase [bacterium]